MNRREFITLLGGAAAWPLEVHAQQAAMQLVAWRASEECSFSTGAVFDLSGGRSCPWHITANDPTPSRAGQSRWQLLRARRERPHGCRAASYAEQLAFVQALCSSGNRHHTIVLSHLPTTPLAWRMANAGLSATSTATAGSAPQGAITIPPAN